MGTTSYNLGARGTCYITTPPGFDPEAAGIPMVLYAHGAGGSANQFATLSAWSGLRAWVASAGWIVVEGTGGGTMSWGNPAAQADYLAYLAHAESLYDIGSKVLLGRSMGGLVTAWLYTQSARAADFDGWINNSGVTTMTVGGSSGGDTVSNWGADLWSAYGAYTYADAVTAILAAESAPEAWAAGDWNGKSILACYGDADTLVPFATRGAGPLLATWDGRADVTLALRPGGDHSSTNGSYLSVDEMAAYLSTFPGSTPVEPPDPVVHYVRRAFVNVGGSKHEMHFPVETLPWQP